MTPNPYTPKAGDRAAYEAHISNMVGKRIAIQMPGELVPVYGWLSMFFHEGGGEGVYTLVLSSPAGAVQNFLTSHIAAFWVAEKQHE